MSIQNIPFSVLKKRKTPILSQILLFGIFCKGLKNEFETAEVNEPSMFEPLVREYNSGSYINYLIISLHFYCF